jgi:hypothetical protein
MRKGLENYFLLTYVMKNPPNEKKIPKKTKLLVANEKTFLHVIPKK